MREPQIKALGKGKGIGVRGLKELRGERLGDLGSVLVMGRGFRGFRTERSSEIETKVVGFRGEEEVRFCGGGRK